MTLKGLIRASLLCLLMTMFVAGSFAQTNFKNGYIVSLKQDTVRGMIDNRGATRNTKLIVFKNEKGEEQKYKPEELIAYHVEGYEYRSFNTSSDSTSSGTKEKTYFFKILESGRIDFLYIRDEQNKDRYFIKKDEGELQELTNAYDVLLF